MSSSGEPSPRRLGLSSLLRQRLSPCLPAHLSTCLSFLRRHASSSSRSSTQQQQQQSVHPDCEAPQADSAVPLKGKAEDTPQGQEADSCLKGGASSSAAQLEELQRALSCWSFKLVAAQAAAAAELQQLLRRAEAAALLQATEARSP
ncbi:hypothetical protein Esti_005331 [Eimeria stiedai]